MYPNRTHNIRKILLIVSVVIFVFLVISFLYSSSFITIDVASNDNKTKPTYRLKNQKTGKEETIQSDSIKKRVTKGEYEVTVTLANQSFFTVVSTKRFLRNTTVSTDLTTQKGRTFIANNPQPCMAIAGDTLLSLNCGSDPLSNVTRHILADKNTPPYILNNSPTPNFGTVETIINTKEGTLALVKIINESGEVSSSGEPTASFVYTIQNIDENLQAIRSVQLNELDTQKTHTLRPYLDGFIVYDNSLSNIYRYASLGANPEKIILGKATIDGLQPTAFDVTNVGNLTLYSSLNDDDKGDNSTSQVIISGDTNSKNLEFNGSYNSAMFCGTNKLCLGTSGNLEVYDISGNKQQFLYRVTGVQSFNPYFDKFTFVDQAGLMEFDVDKITGYYLHTFSPYRFNSITQTPDSYLISLTSDKLATTVLQIDKTSEDNGEIDKKIFSLSQLSNIEKISMSRNFIFIVPELGEPEYNPITKSFEFNEERAQSYNQIINDEIAKLKIDTKAYTIINTYAQ